MKRETTEEELVNPQVPLHDWPERPASITGDEAAALGRMLLDDSVPAQEVVRVLRRGAPSLGPSGEQSPTLRFRVPRERIDALAALSSRLHRNQSDLLREALELLLERHSSGPTRAEDEETRSQGDPLRLRPEEARLLVELSERIAPLTSQALAS